MISRDRGIQIMNFSINYKPHIIVVCNLQVQFA